MAKEEILKVLKQNGNWISSKEIQKIVPYEQKAIFNALKNLVKRKEVIYKEIPSAGRNANIKLYKYIEGQDILDILKVASKLRETNEFTNKTDILLAMVIKELRGNT